MGRHDRVKGNGFLMKNVNGAIGIDLNDKRYIVASLDTGEQLCCVEVECCVKFCNYLRCESQSVVRFKEYYNDLLMSEKIDRLIYSVVRTLVGYAKKNKLVIVLEDLGFSKYLQRPNGSGMDRLVRNNKYGRFVSMLWNECKKHTIPLLFVPHDKTSLKCSRCGYYNGRRKFNKNMFRCENCGLIVDKDVNASINIAREGLMMYMDMFFDMD